MMGHCKRASRQTKERRRDDQPFAKLTSPRSTRVLAVAPTANSSSRLSPIEEYPAPTGSRQLHECFRRLLRKGLDVADASGRGVDERGCEAFWLPSRSTNKQSVDVRFTREVRHICVIDAAAVERRRPMRRQLSQRLMGFLTGVAQVSRRRLDP